MPLLLHEVAICPSWRRESQKILILNDYTASGASLKDKDWPTFLPVLCRGFSIKQLLSERLTLNGWMAIHLLWEGALWKPDSFSQMAKFRISDKFSFRSAASFFCLVSSTSPQILFLKNKRDWWPCKFFLFKWQFGMPNFKDVYVRYFSLLEISLLFLKSKAISLTGTIFMNNIHSNRKSVFHQMLHIHMHTQSQANPQRCCLYKTYFPPFTSSWMTALWDDFFFFFCKWDNN